MSGSRFAEELKRIRAEFPRVAGFGDDILSLADYIDRRPERFYNREAASAMRAVLEQLRREHSDILVRFFREQHEALKTAFRSMEEINRGDFQDLSLSELDDLRRLSVLDTAVHPAYLRLTESVLGTTILPAAQFQRRSRAVDESGLDLHARITEAASGPLAPFLEPFDRTVRNAIAHGGLIFRDLGVEYRDKKKTLEYPVYAVFELFDDAADVCNGFLLAYRWFFIEAADFLAAENLHLPLPPLIRELQVQLQSSQWRVLGVLETLYDNDKTGLKLLVDTTFPRELQVYQATALTAAVAERLAPGFDQYDISIDADGKPKGVGVFGGKELREAREGACRSLMEIAASAKSILIWPPFTEEKTQSAPNVFTPGVPFVRWSRLVRKADYLQLDATIILEIKDRDMARAVVREHAAALVEFAITEAYRAADESLSTLPIGFIFLSFFLRDARQRQLNGLGANLLCRIVERRLGQIETPPLHQSIVEKIGLMRIEWNTIPNI